MKPTEQQSDVVERALEMVRGGKAGDAFKVKAYAGCTKTTTGVLVARAVTPTRLWYLAFNKAIAVEAGAKFPRNTKATTGHSPAWKAMIGRGKLKNELVSGVMPIVRRIEDDAITYAVRTQTKAQKPRKAAFLVVQTLNRFLQSADERPAQHHAPVEWTATITDAGSKAKQARVVAASAGLLWDGMMEDPTIPISHDVYLKAWALTRPKLPFDAIFYDECQDANGVMLDLVRLQDAQQIYVGDPFQSIYQWRGAVDAMERAPGDTLPLTKSFRFGPNIAAEANVILGMLGADLPLIGAGKVEGTVTDDPEQTDFYDAVLCRGNSGVLEETLGYLDDGAAVAVVGGTAEVAKTLSAAYELYDGGQPQHPEIGLFDSWDELAEFANTDEGGQLKPTVRVVEKYGTGVPKLCDRLRYDTVKEEDAEVVVSTAHKAKGREWPNVRLSDDFSPLVVEDEDLPGSYHFRADEARLLYVAATRGMLSINMGGMARQIRADADKLGASTLTPVRATPIVVHRPPEPPPEPDTGNTPPAADPTDAVVVAMPVAYWREFAGVLEEGKTLLAKSGPEGLRAAKKLERIRSDVTVRLDAAARDRERGREATG